VPTGYISDAASRTSARQGARFLVAGGFFLLRRPPTAPQVRSQRCSQEQRWAEAERQSSRVQVIVELVALDDGHE
jgi:hypothetical protein